MQRLAATALTAMVATFAPLAFGADYPNKVVKIVVPYPPGGTTDALSRILGERLQQRFGQPFIVENKPGASEQIAATTVAKSPADGYTIMLITMTGMAVNPGLYGTKLPYDPQKDFTPIIHAVSIPSVVAVHPSLPVKSLGELTSYIKGRPGSISYASAGNGTPSHLGMEMYKRVTQVDAAHVPYKGGAPALQDLMSNQVGVMMALTPEAMPMVKAGKLRALALTSLKRSPLYPDVPTMDEAGVPGFELIYWFSYVAPAGTPKEIVAKLNGAINDVLRDKAVGDKLSEMGLTVVGGTPDKLSEIAHSDAAKWKKLIAEAGITIE